MTSNRRKTLQWMLLVVVACDEDAGVTRGERIAVCEDACETFVECNMYKDAMECHEARGCADPKNEPDCSDEDNAERYTHSRDCVDEHDACNDLTQCLEDVPACK